MSQSTARMCRTRGLKWGLRAAALAAVTASQFLAPASLLAEPTGPSTTDRHVTRAITFLMNREHLTRHPLDNEISGRWMDNYLKMLDPRKVFFTQADVDAWNAYRDQLDDMALKGTRTEENLKAW